MKQSYTRKLTVSFICILLLFSAGVILFERHRAKQAKIETLEERLDGYTDIIDEYLERAGKNLTSISDSLLPLFPSNLRLTIIDINGNILFDNQLTEEQESENHASRPEIVQAKEKGKGSNLRKSATTQKEYLYYAKFPGDNYIRLALPYDEQIQNLLKPDNAFIYYLLFLLILGIFFIVYTARYFGKSISQLKNFAQWIKKQEKIDMPVFPNDEIGYIGQQIAKSYKRINDTKEQLTLEREKLLMHVQSSNEGICFFSSEMHVSFYNGLFLQYINIISDKITSNIDDILKESIFSDIRHFIMNNEGNAYFETSISKQGRQFIGKVNIFYDKSFEIVLTDITQAEKNKILKREMTGNIAHELRTPVAGIRGYLETVLENNLDKTKESEFIKKAYEQTITLSELIRDMSLLTKIDEASADTFQFRPIHFRNLIDRVKKDLNQQLEDKDIIIHSTISDDLTLFGNENLIYSIFRNLTDNVINYAGESITISINQYNPDDRFAYFSFSDNGVGIREERHLTRLFERFYRVTEGRSRETGGSGLGLSIVKNAVEFHGGNISVKNRTTGGLEFLFNLPLF
ncbi:MAG: two-component sensor histidine kinase, partial [Dysgonamonadaceae bacterium]|nr:two-component sensor histidine kinase [Dysgonamonadaceae bacterium]